MFVTKGNSTQIIFGVRGVYRYNKKFFVFGGNDTTFGRGIAILILEWAVMFDTFFRQTVKDGQRFSLCENSRSGIAFFGGGIPVFLVIRKINWGLCLFCLGFLQTQNIRLILLNKRLKQALFRHCPNTIYIPRDKSHK